MDKKRKIMTAAAMGSLLLAVAMIVIVLVKLKLIDNTEVISEKTEDTVHNTMDSDKDNNRNVNPSKGETPENNNEDTWIKVSIYDASPEDLTETEIVTPMTHGLVKYPLLASIPERNLFLYGADDGVIVKHGEILKPFEWIYLTPRFVLPWMRMEDFDNDGTEEILCVTYVASGTGLSIEELHILEPDEAEIYRDVYFNPDDYNKQLSENIAFQFDEENNKLCYQVGETYYEYDAPEVFTEYTYSFLDLGYGWMKSFEYDEGIVTKDYIIYNFEKIAAPVYINSVSAKVIYSDETFTLTDITINSPEQ